MKNIFLGYIQKFLVKSLDLLLFKLIWKLFQETLWKEFLMNIIKVLMMKNKRERKKKKKENKNKEKEKKELLRNSLLKN
jgi:hypothetical protein